MKKPSISTGSISNWVIHWLYIHQMAQVMVRFVPVTAKFHNYNVLYSRFNTYFVTTVYIVIVADMIIGKH